MKSHTVKDKIQQQAVNFSNKHNTILLSFSTGVGKSLAAIKIIESIPGSKWYIICKETNHITNWHEEFLKHKKEHLLPYIKFFCYASLHKYKEKSNLILDEGHAITENRLSYLQKIAGEKVVILSATVDIEKKTLLEKITGNIKEYHIPLTVAIEKGLLPPPEVYIVKVTLNKEQQERYKNLSSKVEYFKNTYFQTQEEWAKFKWLNTALQRKSFIANCKTEPVKKILKILKNKRLICFTNSIEQCEELGGKYVIHSKVKNIKDIIFKFNKGKIDKLFAVNMLREGMNLSNIQAGIITQLDNKKLSFIQMLGRVFRSEFPVCYIIVVEDTQDEVYLNTVLEGFDVKYLKTLNLSELEIDGNI